MIISIHIGRYDVEGGRKIDIQQVDSRKKIEKYATAKLKTSQ